MDNFKKFYDEMMKAVEKDVLDTMRTLAESEGVVNEDGKLECPPDEMIFFLKETVGQVSFVEQVAERCGFRIPIKYTRVPERIFALYLTLHPEAIDRECRNFVWKLPKNPTPEQQAHASRGIRMALEQVYGLKVSEENTLARYSMPTKDELDEAAALVEVEEMLQYPDEDWRPANDGE